MVGRPEDGDPFGRFGGDPEGTQDEKPETTRGNPGPNHSGSDESNGDDVELAEDNSLVNVDVIIKRFKEQTGKSLKDSTKVDYEATFRRFAKAETLAKMTRAKLAGPKGREVILHYLNNEVGLRSWTIVEAKLKAPWMEGLRLPWPLLKRDTPETPPPTRTHTPPDHIVKPWKDAFDHEDAYARVEFKMYGHFGLRPSHNMKILWEDVKNERGEVCWSTTEVDVPYMIEADGYKRVFKKFAWVRAWIPPDLAADIVAWRKELGAEWRPERPLLPFHDASGHLDATRPQTKWAQKHRWDLFIEKWKLARLVPRDFRKFVKSKCNAANMDEVARCYLQGHAPTGMDGPYDNPEMKDLADRQMSRLPQGALGALKDATVTVTDKVSKAQIDLMADYNTGRIGDFAFLEALNKLRPPKPAVEPSGSSLRASNEDRKGI